MNAADVLRYFRPDTPDPVLRYVRLLMQQPSLLFAVGGADELGRETYWLGEIDQPVRFWPPRPEVTALIHRAVQRPHQLVPCAHLYSGSSKQRYARIFERVDNARRAIGVECGPLERVLRERVRLTVNGAGAWLVYSGSSALIKTEK